MPQVLLLIAAGAGLLVAGGRFYLRERARIAAELRAAREAMQQREAIPIVPLERDPATGVYRPKRVTQDTRH